MIIAKNKTDDANAVARLQQWLTILGTTKLRADGIFGPMTAEALKAWQAANGLVPDGVFGPASFAIMRTQIRNHYAGGTFVRGFTRLPADKAPNSDGYTFTALRNDVAPAYNRLYEDAKSHGIIVTSAGGVRALSASVGVGRSLRSLHYAGIAFDMALDTGGLNPETDAFVLEALEGNRWRVWARVYDKTAPNAPKKPTTVKNPVTYRQRNGTGKPVTGLFVDFTDLALKHGWNNIPAHGGWKYTKAITTLEWWHFQFEGVLMPRFSSFGDEVLGLQIPEALAKYPAVAQYRDWTWKWNWLG